MDIEKDKRLLKSELENINKKDFFDRYLDEITEGQASYDEKQNHYDRALKLINDGVKGKPEQFYAYKRYYKECYKSEGRYSLGDRDASWALSVELKTRIATIQLPEDKGQDRAALNSLYSLFQSDRKFRRQYGPDIAQYEKLVDECFTNNLRPFMTYWHKALIEGEAKGVEFRQDLVPIQEQLNSLLNKLNSIAAPKGD